MSAVSDRPGSEPVAVRLPFRHVEHVMGTAVSMQVTEVAAGAGADAASAGVAAAVAVLHRVDAELSPFRPDDLLDRYRRGEYPAGGLPPVLMTVLDRCAAACTATEGGFDPWCVPTGFDPSGLVKGLAVDWAAEALERAGCTAFAVNAGGDVVTRGRSPSGGLWRVGIQHPTQPGRVAAVLATGDAAVATSGGYARGPHIVDPRTGQPAGYLLSATVVGPALAEADAYTTALYAVGEPGLRWLAALGGYDALVVTLDRLVVQTAGMARYRVS